MRGSIVAPAPRIGKIWWRAFQFYHTKFHWCKKQEALQIVANEWKAKYFSFWASPKCNFLPTSLVDWHQTLFRLVSDITGNTGGSAVFSHGSREGPIGSTSSTGSNSRIFGGGVGTGVAALNDSSTGGSCSSSFLALSTNELPSMTAVPPVNSRQRGRFSSSTTAASSDVSSSVESSPSHFKCPTATGAPRHQIFTFTGCIPGYISVL